MVRLCRTTDLPPDNATRQFPLPSGKMLCVANVGGQLYALDNVCPHEGAALGQGTVERGFVVCPWHGWQINPESGAAEQDSMCTVERYAIEVIGNDVMVALIAR